MSKRTLMMVVALVAALAMAATGTLAYLTDTDSDVNVMTLGNVDIELREYQRVVENGSWVSTGETDKYGYTPDKVEPFEQGKPLYPAYFADGDIKWDDRSVTRASDSTHQQSWGQIGAPGSNQLFDDSVVGAQDKFVFVENTGASDAYVRVWFAFEQGDIPADRFLDVLQFNTNADHWLWKTDDQWMFDVEIEGSKYAVTSAVYAGPKSNPTGILAAGDTSYASLLQAYMKPEATGEDIAALGETYEILIFAQAVQTEHLPDAATALTYAFGDNHPWQNKDGSAYDDPGLPAAKASNAEELTAALAEGGTVVLTGDIVLEDAVSITEPASIALNGNTLTVSRLEAADDVKISGGKLVHGESDYPAVSVKGGSLTMDNVEIINDDKPCNVMTSGSVKAVESVALQIFEGDCVLNNCSIYIKHSEKVYYSNVVGISVHDGTLTMNGGSITVESAGSTKPVMDAALCAGSAAKKAFTLNNVSLSVGDAYNLYIFGDEPAEKVVVNTTDAAGSWDGKVYGNATINYK